MSSIFNTIPSITSPLLLVKGAVYKFLTQLKLKNTIICLQIFKKHAKLTLVYLKNNATVSYSPLNMFIPGRNVNPSFGLWNPPTSSLPNCISAPLVASCRKTLLISCNLWSRALVIVGVLNLVTCVCLHQVWGGEARWKKTLSDILNLDCNRPT